MHATEGTAVFSVLNPTTCVWSPTLCRLSGPACKYVGKPEVLFLRNIHSLREGVRPRVHLLLNPN